MADARKPCRCTLLESGQADMAKLVRDYVDSLSADEKTDEATYAARLNICRTCDDLHSGTCALCGCYVEARAAKKRQGFYVGDVHYAPYSASFFANRYKQY